MISHLVQCFINNPYGIWTRTCISLLVGEMFRHHQIHRQIPVFFSGQNKGIQNFGGLTEIACPPFYRCLVVRIPFLKPCITFLQLRLARIKQGVIDGLIEPCILFPKDALLDGLLKIQLLEDLGERLFNKGLFGQVFSHAGHVSQHVLARAQYHFAYILNPFGRTDRGSDTPSSNIGGLWLRCDLER